MARPAAGESSSSDSDAPEEAAEAGAHAAARRQVIFCSRTHSQLSQFVGELRRTRFAESLAVAALGSRQVAGAGPSTLACLLAVAALGLRQVAGAGPSTLACWQAPCREAALQWHLESSARL